MIQAAYKNNTSPQLRELRQAEDRHHAAPARSAGQTVVRRRHAARWLTAGFRPYQGKVVLLVFWAGRACLRAGPSCSSVKTLYEKYHAQGLEVIGVCLDQDAAASTQLLGDMQLPWANITNNKLAEQFGVEVEMIPYLLLTDRQGNIVDLYMARSALDAKLAALLGPAPPATPAVPVNELREPPGETK